MNSLILPDGSTVSLSGKDDVEVVGYQPADSNRTFRLGCFLRPDLADMLDALSDLHDVEPEQIADDILEAGIAGLMQQAINQIQQAQADQDDRPWDELQLPFGD